MPIKNTNEEDAETSDLLCMHMENNAIINNKQHINENCQMLQSEMAIREVVKDCASFKSANGSDLLHICFDNNTEYDPAVVFDKKFD